MEIPIPLNVLDAFEIRCMFDRALVEAAGGYVTAHVLDQASQLEDLVHPWCHVNGQSAGWDFRGAVPIRVRDLLAKPYLVTPHRRDSIVRTAQSLLIRREYGDNPPVTVQLTILTYDIDGTARLALDGSHRLAALALALISNEGWPFSPRTAHSRTSVGRNLSGSLSPFRWRPRATAQRSRVSSPTRGRGKEAADCFPSAASSF